MRKCWTCSSTKLPRITKVFPCKQPDEWAAVIANSFIKILSTNRKSGNTIEKTISLLQFLSVYQVQPVLELKLVLPDYDFYSHNKSSDSDLEFTLNFKDNNMYIPKLIDPLFRFN